MLEHKLSVSLLASYVKKQKDLQDTVTQIRALEKGKAALVESLAKDDQAILEHLGDKTEDIVYGYKCSVSLKRSSARRIVDPKGVFLSLEDKQSGLGSTLMSFKLTDLDKYLGNSLAGLVEKTTSEAKVVTVQKGND